MGNEKTGCYLCQPVKVLSLFALHSLGWCIQVFSHHRNARLRILCNHLVYSIRNDNQVSTRKKLHLVELISSYCQHFLLGKMHIPAFHNCHVINGNKTLRINPINQFKYSFNIFTRYNRINHNDSTRLSTSV
jgi:hypothetical protein